MISISCLFEKTLGQKMNDTRKKIHAYAKKHPKTIGAALTAATIGHWAYRSRHVKDFLDKKDN